MKWPQKIAANVVRKETVGHVDIFSTLVSAAGIRRESISHIPLDGVDLLSLLSEEVIVEGSYKSFLPVTHHVRPPLFWRSGHYRCLIYGDWKLSVADRPRKAWLYNLAQDPTETNNLVPAYIEPDPVSVEDTIKLDDLLPVVLSPSSEGPRTYAQYPSPESVVFKIQDAPSVGLPSTVPCTLPFKEIEEIAARPTEYPSSTPGNTPPRTHSNAEMYNLLYTYLLYLDAQQSKPLWPGLSETPVVVDLEDLVQQELSFSTNNSDSIVWTKAKFANMKPNVHSYSSLSEVLFRRERPIYEQHQIDENTEIVLWTN